MKLGFHYRGHGRMEEWNDGMMGKWDNEIKAWNLPLCAQRFSLSSFFYIQQNFPRISQ